MRNKLLSIVFIAIGWAVFSQDHPFYNPGGYFFSVGAFENRTASVASEDLNNDGYVDVVVANGRHWPQQNYVFLNSGKGSFTRAYLLDSELQTSYAAEIADLDGDGDFDIAVGNDNAPNVFYLNDGNASFVRGGTFGKPISSTRNITLSDIDNDGDIDILITNRGQINEICINDGAANFERVIEFGGEKDSTIAVVVKDMNNDGKADLVLANRDGQQNYVYLQTGHLEFNSKIPFGTGKDETRSVAVADFNSDGFMDIATANIRERNVIYFGNGADHIMTFTRLDLINGAGSAYVLGTCLPLYKYSIIQEDLNSLSVVITAAHELGHNLGLDHDEIENKCNNPRFRYIMSPKNINTVNRPQLSYFSECSINQLNNFADNTTTTCWKNKIISTRNDTKLIKIRKIIAEHFGQIINIHQQCQLQYGPRAIPYISISYNATNHTLYEENICDQLRCSWRCGRLCTPNWPNCQGGYQRDRADACQ